MYAKSGKLSQLVAKYGGQIQLVRQVAQGSEGGAVIPRRIIL